MKTKIKLDLTTVDGNAFSLMGAFSREAKRAGWTREEINALLEDCMRGDYERLVGILARHCRAE